MPVNTVGERGRTRARMHEKRSGRCRCKSLRRTSPCDSEASEERHRALVVGRVLGPRLVAGHPFPDSCGRVACARVGGWRSVGPGVEVLRSGRDPDGGRIHHHPGSVG